MANFSANLGTVYTWGGYPITGTITGTTSRSGTTITVSNLNVALNWSQVIGGSGTATVAFTSPDGNNSFFNLNAYSTTSISPLGYTFTAAVGTSSQSIKWSTSDGFNGTYTVIIDSPPAGGSVTYNSCTWNSVNITSRVSSWGGNYSGTPNLEQIVVNSSADSSNWQTKGRIVLAHATTSTSNTASISNVNQSAAYDGGITIKGCTAFKVAMWGSTNQGSTNAFDNTTRYTPPAPPTASVTDGGYTLTQRKVTLTLTGDSSNNNSANVTFYYRYKKSTDSSYGSWTSMGTGSVTGTKTVTLNLAGSTAYNFQFLQQYQGQNSETKTVNYTTPAVPDQGILYGSVNGQAKRIRKLYGSVNGQAKEIVKLYGSVNGVAKRIY